MTLNKSLAGRGGLGRDRTAKTREEVIKMAKNPSKPKAKPEAAMPKAAKPKAKKKGK